MNTEPDTKPTEDEISTDQESGRLNGLVRHYDCDDCEDTGIVGDMGPGRRGNREWGTCDCRRLQANSEPLKRFTASSCSVVSVLFAREDSIYKAIPGLEVYDIKRDATGYRGNNPVIAHPPCRAWGQLRMMAKPRPGEKELALDAVCQVRLNGGVLEHPAGSTLWRVANLPEPGERDAWGGWTMIVPQFWWGHLADKATRLYVCGCDPTEAPPIPFKLGEAPRTMSSTRKELVAAGLQRPELLKKDRERTPPAFAAWLVELARTCKPNVSRTRPRTINDPPENNRTQNMRRPSTGRVSACMRLFDFMINQPKQRIRMSLVQTLSAMTSRQVRNVLSSETEEEKRELWKMAEGLPKTQERIAADEALASSVLFACPVCDTENPMTSGEEGPFHF